MPVGIKKTIESIINQTLDFEKNIEIIIIDTNDNSKPLYNEYLSKFPNNIKFINENVNATEIKNIGLLNARGKYISFLEIYDYYSEDTLKNILDFAKKEPSLNLITMPMYFYKNGKKENYLNYNISASKSIDLLKHPEYSQLIWISTFFKRESMQNSNFMNEYNEYNAFYNNLLLNNSKMGICKSGSYYIENIEEKALPIEDATMNNDEYHRFIEENLKELIVKIKNNPETSKYLEYRLLNQINWILNIEQSPDNIDFSKLKECLQYIDDEIIFNTLFFDEDNRVLSFILKYGKLNDELMEKLELNTVFIDVYDIINNELNILCNLKNIADRDYDIYVNGKQVEKTSARFPQRDRYSLGHRFLIDNSHEVKIPLSPDEKYEIEFKIGNKTLNIDFSRPCNFSKVAGYAKTKKYLSVLDGKKIIIKKKTTLNWIKQEAKTLIKMLKEREAGYKVGIPFRIGYMLGYPFLRNKHIWFFMDRPESADDNGMHMFKYAVDKDKNIKKYFIINKNSADYSEMEKIGNVVPYKSIKHRYLGLFVENIVTTHPDNGIIYPFWGTYPHLAGLLRSNNNFLQHGIIKDDISPWLNKFSMNLSLFVTSSPKEFESVFDNPYHYDESVVRLLGLPRYDGLKNEENKKQIIIMPSWRRYLTNKSKKFISSTEYFKRFNSLINNEELIEVAKEYGYEMIFRPHPNVYEFIELYDTNDYVKIDSGDTKFQTLFNNGSLLITDYSSVAFDFAYLKKPMIYYQYIDDYHFDVQGGYFKYEEMGFGEVCRDEEEIVNLIIDYIKNDCKIKEEYSSRVESFFLYTDKNNCKRVYDAVKELPSKD